MKSRLQRRKGFTLVTVLLGLAIISILGLTIIGVTTSTLRMTKVDSQSQSAYYIAEAGMNYMLNVINSKKEEYNNGIITSEEFFQDIQSMNITLGEGNKEKYFEENNGESPKAIVTINKFEEEELTIGKYKLISEGLIGGSKRVVESVIKIDFTEGEKAVIDNLLYYTSALVFKGTEIMGENGTIVNDGVKSAHLDGGAKLSVTNIFFNGDVIVDGGGMKSIGNKNQPGVININGDFSTSGGRTVYGDVYVKGNASLKDITINGNLFVQGDIHLGYGSPKVKGEIQYVGTKTTDYGNNIIEVDKKSKKVEFIKNWKVPVREVSLRDDDWYFNNGYNKSGTNKIYVDNYNDTSYKNEFKDVVIVSKSDINIGQIGKFNGALIAPNGKVTTGWIGDFTGVIVAKNGIFANGGGVTMKLRYLQDYFDESNIPVIFKIQDNNFGEEGETGEGLGKIKMTIEVPTKEI